MQIAPSQSLGEFRTLKKSSSCSTIYIDDSTVSQPNLKNTIKCVSLAIYYHIKNRKSSTVLDIFDEKHQIDSKAFENPFWGIKAKYVIQIRAWINPPQDPFASYFNWRLCNQIQTPGDWSNSASLVSFASGKNCLNSFRRSSWS